VVTTLPPQPTVVTTLPPQPTVVTTTADTANAWQTDSRCTTEDMTLQEVKWMDEGVIADNARNESSEFVLEQIQTAQAGGGSCDEVLARFLALMGA
jgi:hypothetical protein